MKRTVSLLSTVLDQFDTVDAEKIVTSGLKSAAAKFNRASLHLYGVVEFKQIVHL